MRSLLLSAVLLTAAAGPLAAQRLGPPEPRPALREGADTNDAQAYYDLGVAQLMRDSRTSAEAFYWAARINPANGDALYGRRSALMKSNDRLLQQMMENTRGVHSSKEGRLLDSLQFRALMMSPFLYRRFDRDLYTTYVHNDVVRSSRMSGGGEPNAVELDYEINIYLQRGGASTRAWMAYGAGDFDNALSLYASALKTTRNPSYVHMERARIFGMKAQVDSAVAEMKVALEAQRKEDSKDLVIFYESKALAEYSTAVLLEGAGKTDAAREAYGRALQEDLAYYPAHMRLGLLAAGLKDTANAVSELALASQLAPEEPHVRYVHGFVLALAHRPTEAIVEFKKAVELEPCYALPYVLLGQMYESNGDGPNSAAAYKGFLAHAAQTDPQRDFAAAHLKEITQFLADQEAMKKAAAAATP